MSAVLRMGAWSIHRIMYCTCVVSFNLWPPLVLSWPSVVGRLFSRTQKCCKTSVIGARTIYFTLLPHKLSASTVAVLAAAYIVTDYFFCDFQSSTIADCCTPVGFFPYERCMNGKKIARINIDDDERVMHFAAMFHGNVEYVCEIKSQTRISPRRMHSISFRIEDGE